MRYFLLVTILFCINVTFAQSERKYARDGNKNYSDSLFTKAEVNYRKALAKSPSFGESKFNLSNSLFRQNRFDEAELVLNDIINHSSDSLLKSEAYYNLGNNFLQQQKLQEAIDSYKNCLRINPGDEQARYNLSKSLELLKLDIRKKSKKIIKENDLYAITANKENLLEIIEDLLIGGVKIIQHRVKSGNDKDRLKEATQIKNLCK